MKQLVILIKSLHKHILEWRQTDKPEAHQETSIHANREEEEEYMKIKYCYDIILYKSYSDIIILYVTTTTSTENTSS